MFLSESESEESVQMLSVVLDPRRHFLSSLEIPAATIEIWHQKI